MAVSRGKFEFALEQVKPGDWEKFEVLCSAFLADGFAGLRTMASPGGDRGRDAELYSYQNEPNYFFQYSVSKDWKSKILATVSRISEEFSSVKSLVFLSPRKIGASSDDIVNKFRHLGIAIDVRDMSWFLDRMNSSSARSAAADHFAAQIADPILESKGVLALSESIKRDEMRIALTFLELQAKDDEVEKGLTKKCFESLVRAALAGSSATQLVSREEVYSRVTQLLPQHTREQLKNFIDSALSRLQKQFVKHHANNDSFHIEHEEQQNLSNRIAELELLRGEFVSDINEIALIMCNDCSPGDLENIESLSIDIIERYFYELGEDFAQAVANDKLPSLREDVIERLCDELSPPGMLDTNYSWNDLLRGLIVSLMNDASPRTVRYLELLSSAYTLFAFLSATPDVQKVT